jgi:hypothetical protein
MGTMNRWFESAYTYLFEQGDQSSIGLLRYLQCFDKANETDAIITVTHVTLVITSTTGLYC